MAVLSDDDVAAALAGREGWTRDGDAILKRFTREGGFVGAVAFVDALVAPAERMNHHPDLEIGWNTVTVRLSTHSEGGVTERDLALADEIDRLA